MKLTADRVREVLIYDELTGIVTWKMPSSYRVKIGDVAGTVCTDRYIRIGIDNKGYTLHRVIWLYQTGEWPRKCIDHIDGDRLNNKWDNLRVITQGENNKNRRVGSNLTKSRVMGVYWYARTKKWHVNIGVNGRLQHIGYYEDLSEAICARKKAEEIHGFHENHGRAA